MALYLKCLNHKENPVIRKIIFFILIFLLFGFIFAIWFMFSYPKKTERQKYIKNIMRVNGNDVNKILIKPYNPSHIENDSGVQRAFNITNKETIIKFCNQLNLSSKYVPSHPAPDWSCVVTIFMKNKKVMFKAERTINAQGFMIPIFSEVTTGWFYGFYRNDKLGEIILDEWDKYKKTLGAHKKTGNRSF